MKTLFMLVVMLAFTTNLYAQKGYYNDRDTRDLELQYEIDRSYDRPVQIKPMDNRYMDRMMEQEMRRMETMRTLQMYDMIYGDSPRGRR